MDAAGRPSHEGRELKLSTIQGRRVRAGRPSHEGRELKHHVVVTTLLEEVAPRMRGVN